MHGSGLALRSSPGWHSLHRCRRHLYEHEYCKQDVFSYCIALRLDDIAYQIAPAYPSLPSAL